MIAALALPAMPVHAQTTSITGSVSAIVDHLPNAPAGAATELRVRALVDAAIDPAPWLRVRLAGVADGLAADRQGAVRDVAIDAREAWVEFAGRRGDLRAGAGRLTWGRLDEVQPTDVINPLDVATYLLEGRSEARLPVAFVRGRVFAGESLRLEGVIVPVFRRATFDRLDEASSPFNLLADLPPPPCLPGFECAGEWSFARETPDAGRLQGGARLGVTSGRVDWSVSAWRGFEPFALVDGLAGAFTLRQTHPRYTMLGADMETVTGPWAWRAEAAYFPGRSLQVEGESAVFEGDSLEAGAGLDRRAGDFTLSATVLVRRQDVATRASAPDALAISVRTNVSLVGGFSRTYARDRFETRVFTLVNPEDRAAFLRGVLTWKPADDVVVESSVGWFAGEGDDVITRFADRDFVYLRMKYYFGG